MKRDAALQNSLKSVRTRLGLSQQELANRAGVSRQTIGSVESGAFAPSATVALRLASALECPVDQLFWLEDKSAEIEAVPIGDFASDRETRVAMARVGNRWLAYPLTADEAFREEMVPSDGTARMDPQGEAVRVRLMEESESLERTVMMAGCTPAMSLWARAAERWNPGLRVHWLFANSSVGLQQLRDGQVHAAGVHVYDPTVNVDNLPLVQRVLGRRHASLINLGVWEEGLVVAPGNPKRIRGADDLAREDVNIVNREEGAGSRHLLDLALRQVGVPSESVRGYDRCARSHTEVARNVANGIADAGVTAASVADAFGLGFVPLREVRYDVAVLREYLDEPAVREWLSTLSHRRVRRQLEALGGYDTTRTGEEVGVI